METRLIIAYSLIAIMALSAIIIVGLALRRREKKRLRDLGRGDHMM
jgi:hypothetical protein